MRYSVVYVCARSRRKSLELIKNLSLSLAAINKPDAATIITTMPLASNDIVCQLANSNSASKKKIILLQNISARHDLKSMHTLNFSDFWPIG